MSGCVARPSIALLLGTLVLTTGFADQPSGSLHIRLDQTACNATDEVGVYRVITTPTDNYGGKNTARNLVGQSRITPDCTWALGDLSAGEYEVWFQHTGAKVAVRPV